MASTSAPTTISVPLVSSGCTTIQYTENSHVWTINNFSPHQKLRLASSAFGDIRGLKWCIGIFSHEDIGAHGDSTNYIALHLVLLSFHERNKLPPEVRFRFSLLDATQKPVHKSEFIHWQPRPQTFKDCLRFIKRDIIGSFLVNDQLLIRCEIRIQGIAVNTLHDPRDIQQCFPVPECTLSDDLRSMLMDQESGDTVIAVGDKEFLVHRDILQARNPVFARMFQHELREQMENRIVITDMEAVVVEEMLTFIYTGRSPNLKTMAKDLLFAADKYDVERLKLMSEKCLAENLTRENAISVLISAYTHKANKLKRFVLNFIGADRSYFLDDTVLENIMLSPIRDHPKLLCQMIKALCEYGQCDCQSD